jgi:phage terminase small subunit
MARPRNPKRDESFQLWINSKGEMKLKDIAEQLELSDSQIRKWKNQDKWDEQLNGNVTKSKGNVTKQKQSNKVIKKEPVVSELVVSDDNELTDKQRLFVAFYVKSWNATKAYKKAYECGYNTAMVEGSRHLRNPKINAEIIRVRDEITGDALLSKRVLIPEVD